MIFFYKILLHFAQLSFSSMTEHQDQTSTKIRRLKSALNQRVALARVFAEARLERSDGSSSHRLSLLFSAS